MRNFLSVFFLLVGTVAFAQKGTIAGKITDKDVNNEPMSFANVVLKGTTIGTATDIDGNFELAVDPGNYTVEISFVGYETILVPVTVVANQTVTINRAMSTGSVKLEDVVLVQQVNKEKQNALILDQKNAIEIKQSIGAQEMQRKGVSNVEQGVTKISGVSKVADRGIFIRGLDDRYNYLQINGLNFIPSDPNLKTIPLQFIPTDIVRNIDVFKTFNPSLYQDFAGASINVWTKDIPSKGYTKVSISTGFNTDTFGKDFKTDGKSGSDYFGFGSKSREIPTVFNENNPRGYTASPQESLGLFNSSWTPEVNSAPVTANFGLTTTDVFNLSNDRRIGYLINVNFGNNYLNQTGQRRNLNTEGTAFKDFQVGRFTYTTQKSALLSVIFKKSGKYEFSNNLIFLQNSENRIEEIQGENTDFITIDRPFFLRDAVYSQNTSIGLQHLGTLFFNEKKSEFNYGIGITRGINDMPDRKILITEGVGADADFVTFNGANPFRFFSNLVNNNINAKAEYSLNFGKGEDELYRNNLKFGVNSDFTNYNFFNRTIRLNGGGNLADTSMNTDDPQSFFNQNFQNGSLFYQSTSDPTYEVEVNQFIQAGYVTYTKTWKKLILDLGVRIEYLFRETRYRNETDAITAPKKTSTYDPIDFNPALNLKYLLTDKANLRFTASKTSTKPRFREILPFRYQDGDGNFTFGNKDLLNTQNYNVDLKYEYFPNNSSLLSAAIFGKVINDPITRLLEGTSTGFLTSYENFDRATLYGLEVESNFGLDLLFKENALAKRFNLGLNAIFMKSKEEADPTKFPRLTSSSRSLQGASDIIFNGDIVYDLIKNTNTESKVSFIFNTFSERIYAVGTDGAADIKQKPINTLDFTWRNTFKKKYQLNLTVRNLLDAEILATQDPTRAIANPDAFSNVNNRLTQGTNVNLEFTYTF
ncbi:TonB-dependent receptor domain-containing protein [Flavobacterium sp.]|uniref:TonB-dependent receptor n=1 Tax=Flavobacterium sp. TaxID=239 RepID=UPI003B9C29FC